jgi:alpha-1,6-mannosyltransferase
MINIFVITISTFLLAYIPNQNEFSLLISLYSLAFLAYWFLANQSNASFFSYLVFGLSFIPLFAFPNLSDDVYRFQWDGELLYHGISPFSYLPQEVPIYASNEILLGLYPKLNSPNYYSVYPFTCQVIFYIATLLSKVGLSFALSMKLFYIAIHLFSFLLIKKVTEGKSYNLAWYYLNPLVIIEGIGNLHAEIVMVAFLAISLYFFNSKKIFLGLVAFALGIATKLTILVALPILLFYWISKRQFQYVGLICMVLFLMFFPLFYEKGIIGFFSSIDLYFRKFEFNGSIYYLFRSLGKLVFGYNIIAYLGPILGAVLIIYITNVYKMIASVFSKVNEIKIMMVTLMYILPVHLLLSTTVHPWYLITVLFINVFFEYKWLILWSLLIMFTYINYSQNPYTEVMPIVIFEYLSLFLAIYLENKQGGLQVKIEKFVSEVC